VAVAISGVIVSMWSFFRSSEKQDKIVNLKKDELNKKDEEIGELKRANMLNEERLELLKNQVDRQYIQAKNQLKSCLDDFVSIGRGDDIISFGHPKRKELQKKMTDVGNSFKTVIENIEKLILLPQDMLNKAKRIAESIINLSKKIARGVMGVKGEEATEPRDQKVVEEWDELVERAKKLSEELQQDEK
jgi:succinate dehydrogenase/fumarate reductase flavoprotein subunit